MVKINGRKIENYENDYEKNALDFCNKHKVTMIIKFDILETDAWKDGSSAQNNRYDVTIRRNKKSMRIKFYDSVYNTKNGIEPTPYDILSCLTKFNPYDFETFCFDFGYDVDSRKAYDIYLAVTKEWEQVERVFSDILDELREIE